MIRLPAVLGLLLLTATPALAQTKAERAEKLLDADRYGEGLALAAEAAKEAPETDPEAPGIYGRALFRLKRFKEATEQLEKARQNGWDNYGRSYLARIAFYYGQEERALELVSGLKQDHWVRRTISRLMKPAGMVRSETKHYVIWTSQEVSDAGGGKFAGQLLELIHKAYSKVFPFKTEGKRVGHVYLFPDQNGLRRFAHFVWQRDPVSSTGLHYGDQGALLLRTGYNSRKGTRLGFSDDGIKTLFHEAFHQFIDMHTPDTPDWLNEGMAEYFETAVMAGKKKLDVGIPQHTRLQDLRDSFAGRNARTYPLKQFLKISYDAFHQDSRESLNYSQAWGIVHFLLHGPAKKKGRKALKDYFSALRVGKSPDQAHAETFGKMDLKKLEAAWKDYLNRL